MSERIRGISVNILGIALCLYVLAEVNHPRLKPQSQLALFVLLGLVLCFLVYPLAKRFKGTVIGNVSDVVLILLSVVSCGYVLVQTEPEFTQFWVGGKSLGDRVGMMSQTDLAIGAMGLIAVLEATRRSIGLILPVLAGLFIAHSYYCYLANMGDLPILPRFLFPHAGQDMGDIVSTTFLKSLGVFGPAASVMFTYVFLFVVFGAFLEMSGATQFIIDFAERIFGRSPGGPAKVAVLGSGLMGSLSGSAVANAMTTGTFTIPMMRNAGFDRTVAGGITAAAASGGALVPPVMGAGAYMMLEIVQPQPTFLQIAKAALIPAVLYYLSIFLFVHFYSRRVGNVSGTSDQERKAPAVFEGFVFFLALGSLVFLLLLNYTAFRAVTVSLVVILVLSAMRPKLPLTMPARIMALAVFAGVLLLHHAFFLGDIGDPSVRNIFRGWIGSTVVGMFGLLIFGLIHPSWRGSVTEALVKSAKGGISLVAASACVGIIIGIVQQTGIASDFSAAIKGMVESSLLAALVGIMFCSLILGMGVPSVVCYLLMATLMGSLLSELGVVPLAAHLFIFYFGMMSMVTPPVALAAYASASIAESPIMATSFAAFRVSLVGFTLPFMFVYRPELLMLAPGGESATMPAIAIATVWAVLGIFALAAATAGFLWGGLNWPLRIALLVAAAALLSPDIRFGDTDLGLAGNIGGAVVLVVVAILSRKIQPAGVPPDEIPAVANSNSDATPNADAEPPGDAVPNGDAVPPDPADGS